MTNPVRTYADPRIEVYAPAGSSPYYRLVAYDTYGNRTVNTTGGRTLRSAQTRASKLSKQPRRRSRSRSGDPTKVLVRDEVELWLDPMNHRTRENRPWSQRRRQHGDRMAVADRPPHHQADHRGADRRQASLGAHPQRSPSLGAGAGVGAEDFAGFLRDDLAELIAHRQTESGEDDPIIFCAPRGGWEWRHNHGRRFRTARERAGWPEHITWYGLRHLYAVTMLERLPLEIVSKLMGRHSPDFTAKRYLSLRVGWLDQARAASRNMDL